MQCAAHFCVMRLGLSAIEGFEMKNASSSSAGNTDGVQVDENVSDNFILKGQRNPPAWVASCINYCSTGRFLVYLYVNIVSVLWAIK